MATKIERRPWTIEQVMAYTGLKRDHLAQLRFRGTGPAFHKPTKRTVIYDNIDVIDLWDKCKTTTTGPVARGAR